MLAAALPILFLHVRFQPGFPVTVGSTSVHVVLSDLAVLAVAAVALWVWFRDRPRSARGRWVWIASVALLVWTFAAVVYPRWLDESYDSHDPPRHRREVRRVRAARARRRRPRQAARRPRADPRGPGRLERLRERGCGRAVLRLADPGRLAERLAAAVLPGPPRPRRVVGSSGVRGAPPARRAGGPLHPLGDHCSGLGLHRADPLRLDRGRDRLRARRDRRVRVRAVAVARLAAPARRDPVPPARRRRRARPAPERRRRPFAPLLRDRAEGEGEQRRDACPTDAADLHRLADLPRPPRRRRGIRELARAVGLLALPRGRAREVPELAAARLPLPRAPVGRAEPLRAGAGGDGRDRLPAPRRAVRQRPGDRRPSALRGPPEVGVLAVLWLLVCIGVWNALGIIAGIPMDALTWVSLGMAAAATQVSDTRLRNPTGSATSV